MRRLIILHLILFLSVLAQGQSWEEVNRLDAPDPQGPNFFGNSSSISEHHLIVGAHGDDELGSSAGAAYIFEKVDGIWIEKQKLLAFDGVSYDDFGFDVAISGNIAVIGSIGSDVDDQNTGAAYIFEKEEDIWIEKQKIVASDADESDLFGYSVSISGNILIVGAYKNDDNGYNSGSAYIFEKEGDIWSEKQKLVASDGNVSDSFGKSVSISDEIVIIGSVWNDDFGDFTGSAYIFELEDDVWVEKQKLLASDADELDMFGFSVSISSNQAIVSSIWNEDDEGVVKGSAYIFEKQEDEWVETQKLIASDGNMGDNFGKSVSISDNKVIVGADFTDDFEYASGSAYIFEKEDDVWIEKQKLLASDASSSDQFGWEVSISGYSAFVSTYCTEDEPNITSSIYVFETEPQLEINEINREGVFSIYPNPNDGTFTINSNVSNTQITLYSIEGKMVKEISISHQNTTTISDLERGIYLVKISSEQFESISRLVVQ